MDNNYNSGNNQERENNPGCSYGNYSYGGSYDSQGYGMWNMQTNGNINNTGMGNNRNISYTGVANNGNKNGRGFGKGIAVGALFAVFAFLCVILLQYFMKGGEKESDGKSSGSFLSQLLGSSDAEGIFTEEELRKIQRIKAYIDEYSYYEQDRDKLMDGVYSAILGSLDDNYAAYYNEEAYSSMMSSSVGEYSGIGCVVSQDPKTGQVIAVQPYKGSPAYEAGISMGDIILKADGIELTGMDLNEAVTYIQGEEGSTVSITFIHDGEERTVDVERRKIEVPTIEYEMLEGNIGYIQISGFESVTAGQFEKALEELMDDGAKGLIFDVRSNPGGMYDTVVSMLDTLLPEGTIVYTEDKYGNRDTETSDADCIKLPMAVLINGDSASASEIFAGALQDYDWAEIIGTQSFGKGIVQSVVPLGDGTGMKFTISSYFTPKGVCIHGIGITPDKEVELPSEDEAYDDNGYLKEGYDTQLDAAIEYIEGQ